MGATVTEDRESPRELEHRVARMRRLVAAVQDLSLARSVESIRAVVRGTARELVAADGATFILRQGDHCFYADEDAIGPLWKGQRFPMTACVSGWAMLHRQPVTIEDIYRDERVPVDSYRPTFVKSLVIVPIRSEDPIGAIGTYWGRTHRATPDEVELLQALANTTAVALENVQLYGELEQRVRERTQQLEDANHDLEAFAASVSHDLRSPLTRISGFAQVLAMDGRPWKEAEAKQCLAEIVAGTKDMSRLIDDLLRLAHITKAELQLEEVNLTALAESCAQRLSANEPERKVAWNIEQGMSARGDRGLLRVVVDNLLGNAWKYTARAKRPQIEFRTESAREGEQTFRVRDNGAGFDMAQAEGLFQPFQRLHPKSEFEGHGVGLATVARILHRHGGRIWAEAAPGQGAAFRFTLPEAQ